MSRRPWRRPEPVLARVEAADDSAAEHPAMDVGNRGARRSEQSTCRPRSVRRRRRTRRARRSATRRAAPGARCPGSDTSRDRTPAPASPDPPTVGERQQRADGDRRRGRDDASQRRGVDRRVGVEVGQPAARAAKAMATIPTSPRRTRGRAAPRLVAPRRPPRARNRALERRRQIERAIQRAARHSAQQHRA